MALIERIIEVQQHATKIHVCGTCEGIMLAYGGCVIQPDGLLVFDINIINHYK